MEWKDNRRSAAETPRVSVVIATLNRPREIVAAVESVVRGTEQQFEVVVVDQSSDEASRAALHGAYGEDVRIRYVHDVERGAARARNVGLRNARAAVFAIIDDDCIASLTWLSDILTAFERHTDVEMLFGRVEAPRHDYRREVIPVLLLTRRDRRIERNLAGRAGRLQGISANMAVRQETFAALGGFDSRFGVGGERWSGEDFELHYRALREGRCVLIEPGVSVVHHGKRTMEDAWELWRRDALGCGALAAHIAGAGSPKVALQLWWWYIGRIWWKGTIRALTLHFPTGLRLAWWMSRFFGEGFRVERRARKNGAT